MSPEKSKNTGKCGASINSWPETCGGPGRAHDLANILSGRAEVAGNFRRNYFPC